MEFGRALPPLGDLEQACDSLVLSLPVCKKGRCCLGDCEGPSSRATSVCGAGRTGVQVLVEEKDTKEGSGPAPPVPVRTLSHPLPSRHEEPSPSAPGGLENPAAASRNGFWEERSWSLEKNPDRICGRGPPQPPAPAPAPRSGRVGGGLLSSRVEGKGQSPAPPGARGSGAGGRGLRSGAPRVTCEEGRKSRKAGRRAGSWEFSARRGRRELGLPGKPGTRRRRGPGSETAGTAPGVRGRE